MCPESAAEDAGREGAERCGTILSRVVVGLFSSRVTRKTSLDDRSREKES
jgi:hypothetical protein